MKIVNCKLKINILDLLFPPVCFGCKGEGKWLCLECEKIYLSKPLIQRVLGRGKIRVISLTKYHEENIKYAIYCLKYRSVKKYGEALGGLLAQKLPSRFFDNSILIPIPLSKSKIRERGFNQAEIISQKLAERFNRSICKALMKIKSGPSQVEMENKKERRQNIKGSFCLAENAGELRGKRIILIDDVVTTGATLLEASKVLRRAKPIDVRAITIADDI